MTYQGQVELWDAINLLVAASGGMNNTSVARQNAVVAVESAVKGVVAAELASLRIQRDDLVARLLRWCRQGGRDLCPTPGSSDTFGDGIRQAQRAIQGILAAEQQKPEVRP